MEQIKICEKELNSIIMEAIQNELGAPTYVSFANKVKDTKPEAAKKALEMARAGFNKEFGYNTSEGDPNSEKYESGEKYMDDNGRVVTRSTNKRGGGTSKAERVFDPATGHETETYHRYNGNETEPSVSSFLEKNIGDSRNKANPSYQRARQMANPNPETDYVNGKWKLDETYIHKVVSDVMKDLKRKR